MLPSRRRPRVRSYVVCLDLASWAVPLRLSPECVSIGAFSVLPAARSWACSAMCARGIRGAHGWIHRLWCTVCNRMRGLATIPKRYDRRSPTFGREYRRQLRLQSRPHPRHPRPRLRSLCRFVPPVRPWCNLHVPPILGSGRPDAEPDVPVRSEVRFQHPRQFLVGVHPVVLQQA
jgi:hypothetical protein